MKLAVRISALVLLATSAATSRLGAPGPVRRPFEGRPAGLDALRGAGELTVALDDAAASGQGARSGTPFDYGLLRRFASELALVLTPRRVASAEEALSRLALGTAALAVVPLPAPEVAGVVAIASDADLRADESDPSPAFALFVRSESSELVAALQRVVAESPRGSAASERTARSDGDEEFAAELGRIEPYASLLMREAEEAGLDWRFVAATISEESSFDENAVSPKGATGLMQLMPCAGAAVGVEDVRGASANVHAGVLYLRRLWEMFPEARRENRLSLVLAAYLMGPGHLLDAQRLAQGLGLNPYRWHGSLDQVLPLLEQESFFAQAQFGFARGQHAVDYVSRVLARYDYYKQHLDREPRQTARPHASHDVA